MLVNQFSETEPFVQFANQNQATVGGDVRSLESGYALHSRLPHILWLAGPPAA